MAVSLLILCVLLQRTMFETTLHSKSFLGYFLSVHAPIHASPLVRTLVVQPGEKRSFLSLVNCPY